MKTKQEVIKALELCAEAVTEEFYPCDQCPYGKVDCYDNETCSAALKRDAAELLKKSVQPLVIERVPEVDNES